MSKVNKYNMITWDDDGTPSTSCASEYSYPIIEGDVINFYINFFANMALDASGWEIGWWTPGSVFIEDITTLNVDSIDGINSNVYGSVTVGVLPRSLLRLVIYDPDNYDEIKYWSNPFKFVTSTSGTSVLKYRNARSVLNYEFENITTFYNQVRINVRIGEPIVASDVTGYMTSAGRKVRSRSLHTVTREFETQFFDEYAHQGFEAATQMSAIYFDSVRYERAIDAQYTQQTVPKDYSFWLGRLRLEQYDFTAVAANT